MQGFVTPLFRRRATSILGTLKREPAPDKEHRANPRLSIAGATARLVANAPTKFTSISRRNSSLVRSSGDADRITDALWINTLVAPSLASMFLIA
nr:hypothetical protein [uncultured Tateyamaria sp.]